MCNAIVRIVFATVFLDFIGSARLGADPLNPLDFSSLGPVVKMEWQCLVSILWS